MCKQVAAAGGKVRGVLWYQGESDANAEASAIFPEKLAELIAAMRADFGNSDLPFLQVQIGRVVLPWDVAAWNRIQTAQLDAANKIPDGAHLWYGRGTVPYCNIMDESEMALPVFGPVPIP